MDSPTLLYSPSLVPDPEWVKRAVFWGFDVASLAPQPGLPKVLQGYEDLGIWTGVHLEMDLTQDEIAALGPECLQAVKKNEGKTGQALSGRDTLHAGKLPYAVTAPFEELGLLESRPDESLIESRPEVVATMLAVCSREIADRRKWNLYVNREATTDQALAPVDDRTAQPALEITAQNLPAPHPDVPLEEIVQFRADHAKALAWFRDSLSKPSTAFQGSGAIKDAVTEAETAAAEITALAQSMGIGVVSHARHQLRSLSTWDRIAMGAAAVDVARALADEGLNGLSAGAVVQFGMRMTEVRKEVRTTAYLRHALARGVLRG